MKAILFDFGGTIDTNGVHWSEKYSELYARFQPEIEKRDVEKAFVESERRMSLDAGLAGATFKETILKQLTLQFGLLKLSTATPLLNAMLDACYAEVVATVAAAKEVLVRLNKEYRMALVSNFYGNLDVVCGEFGIKPLFEAMIDSTTVGLRKPDPSIFDLALTQLRVRGSDAYVVGDSYDRDIVPARKLGCTTIWLKGKSWKEEAATDAADYTITNFEQIISIITQHS